MALRIPSPVALTKPEAYLAYKAGILSRGELKDKLLNPINNYEGWLAKWCELLETYPTNEDGTPQCLTDEEGLLAYLCGVTNRYPASNSNPDDARVSAYIRYLVSARYARPDHPLNREEFYLSLIKTQFIPSGDPSSDIVIDGTTKAPFLDVKVYGGTLQYSYSGKNLFDRANAYENNGLKWSDGAPYAEQKSIAMSNYVAVTTGDKISSNFKAQVMFYKSDNTYIGALQTDGTTIARTGGGAFSSFTVPNDSNIALVRLGFRSTANNNVDMNTQNVMVNFGDTVQPYERYVGGIPAPNPSYPQPISVVTGENVVKVVGKNLFDITPRKTGDGYYNSNTGFYVDNSYDDSVVTYETTENGLTATILTAWKGLFFTSSPLQAGTQYHFKWDITSTGNVRASVYTLDSSFIIKRRIGNYTTNLTSSNANITLQDGEMYIGLWIGTNNANDVLTISQPQIELGSTATSYQAFTEQDYTISLGELELAKIGTYQDRIYKDGEKWYVKKQVGKVVYTGASGEGWRPTSGNSNYFYTEKSDVGFAPSDSTVGAIMSDNYTATTANRLYSATDDYGIAIRQSPNHQIWIRNKDCADKTAFLTWLASNPTTIYYALATPTTTEITNQSLIDQLNALKQGGAEEGTTYIRVSATDPNLPAKLYVEAPKYD